LTRVSKKEHDISKKSAEKKRNTKLLEKRSGSYRSETQNNNGGAESINDTTSIDSRPGLGGFSVFPLAGGS
jgi:hypothetical protein